MTTYEKEKVEIVKFNLSDVPGLIRLSASVGWDYDEKEITTVLLSGEIFGHKDGEGEIVSSAAIIPYEKGLASIGMVIVHDDYRGLGLGKEVTKKCINSVSSNTAIMLIATEEGKGLYERLGFQTVDFVHKYICENDRCKMESMIHHDFHIEDYTQADFQEIVRIDKEAFGVSRGHFLLNRISQAERCLVMRDGKGVIVGYGLSIQGPINLILGPIVAPDFQAASLLIEQLSSDHQGKLRMDVPSGNEEFMMFLEKRGFVKVSQPPIMMLHSDVMPHRNNTLFGIAAQIFG